MKMQYNAKKLCEDMLKLNIIEAGLDTDPRIVTAGEEAVENIVSRIETIRKKIREEADEVTVGCMEQLAGLLRQVTHVLTDLVYSKAARGENGKPMQKLQDQIMNVLKNLAINGFEDEDKNGDGFRDDADLGFIEDDDNEGHSDVNDAIKQALRNAKRVDKDLEKHDSTAPKPTGDEEPESEDQDPEAEQEQEPAPKPAKNLMQPPAKKLAKPAPKPGAEDDAGSDEEDPEADPEQEPEDDNSEEEDTDNFMGNLLKEDEEKEAGKKGKAKAAPEYGEEIVTSAVLQNTLGYMTTAGLRFMYMGIREVKGREGKVQAIKVAIGDNSRDPGNITAYYYVIDTEAKKPLLGGDIEKLDRAYTKLLRTENGYAALMQSINVSVRKQELYVLGKKAIPVSEALTDSPKNYWSYMGLREHPKSKDKGAIWLDLGAQRFAMVATPVKDQGKLSETADWLKAVLVGGKDSGGSGMTYDQGFAYLTALVKSGKIAGIPCALKTIYVESI